MAIILFNPTHEVMKTQYIGEDVVIPPAPDPRHKMRVDDARGRHVLNVLGPKGLVTLEYGDEGQGELKKAEEGRQRNKDFWRKQVMDFNQLNDQRQAQRLPYIAPMPEVREASARLGIRLIEPYSTTDEATKVTQGMAEKLDAKERELIETKGALANLERKFSEMGEMMKALLAAQGKAAEPAPSEWDDLKVKVKTINGKHLQNWVASNFNQIQGYPADVQAFIRERWEKFYPVPYPETAEEAQASVDSKAVPA